MYVAVKTTVVRLRTLAATDALNVGDRFTLAKKLKGFDPTDGEDVYVLGQLDTGGPRADRVGVATGPVDGDPMLCQPLELLGKKHDGPRTDIVEIDHVAAQQQSVGALGHDRFKHLLGDQERGVEEQIAQMLRHFGNSAQGTFQVKVAGVDKTERGLRPRRLRHHRLLAYASRGR